MNERVDAVNELRLGLVGAGRTGTAYSSACEILDDLRLTCVCDRVPERAAGVVGAKLFREVKELLGSTDFDALIVATSIDNRAEIALQALERGFSVLMEGPVSQDATRASDLALVVEESRGKLICGVSRPLRLEKRSQKLKELTEGAFGRPHRMHWTLTDRFRSENFFSEDDEKSSESPGSLTCQLRDELDLLLWLYGEPEEVEATRCLGKHHDVEVEDEIFVRFAWEDGATGSLVASSGEIPGIDRLEMASDRGLIVSESEQPIRWSRCETSVEEFSRSNEDSYGRPPLWKIEIPVQSSERESFRKAATLDFCEALRLGGKPLASPRDDANLLLLMDRIARSANNRESSIS